MPAGPSPVADAQPSGAGQEACTDRLEAVQAAQATDSGAGSDRILSGAVTVHGLASEAGQKLNGRVGTIRSFDEEKARYLVVMDDDSAEALVKTANLTVVTDIESEVADEAVSTADGAGADQGSSPKDKADVEGEGFFADASQTIASAWNRTRSLSLASVVSGFTGTGSIFSR
jgi:hypothetical protein